MYRMYLSICRGRLDSEDVIVGYCRNCVVRINMAEEGRKGLLEGTQPYSSQQIPNNEYNEALFQIQEKGKSPTEVRVLCFLMVSDVIRSDQS